ncbi:MAG: tetratricopeptide repeat protein [Gemmatimonadetes bacterium]|nr:tetratricopeptide repeat protein [Gemmatimonadota bacterium]
MLTRGKSSLDRGATGAARQFLQTLVDNYPLHDRVADAQQYIAESYEFEGNKAAADSVYAMVVAKYPTADVAPTALYKRARLLEGAGQTEAARALFQQIVDKYPRADASLLAGEWLKTHRRP